MVWQWVWASHSKVDWCHERRGTIMTMPLEKYSMTLHKFLLMLCSFPMNFPHRRIERLARSLAQSTNQPTLSRTQTSASASLVHIWNCCAHRMKCVNEISVCVLSYMHACVRVCMRVLCVHKLYARRTYIAYIHVLSVSALWCMCNCASARFALLSLLKIKCCCYDL